MVYDPRFQLASARPALDAAELAAQRNDKLREFVDAQRQMMMEQMASQQDQSNQQDALLQLIQRGQVNNAQPQAAQTAVQPNAQGGTQPNAQVQSAQLPEASQNVLNQFTANVLNNITPPQNNMWVGVSDQLAKQIADGKVSESDLKGINSSNFMRYMANQGIMPGQLQDVNRIELTEDYLKPFVDEWSKQEFGYVNQDETKKVLADLQEKFGGMDFNNKSLSASDVGGLVTHAVTGAVDLGTSASDITTGVLGRERSALAKALDEGSDTAKKVGLSDWQYNADKYVDTLMDRGDYAKLASFLAVNPTVALGKIAEFGGSGFGIGALIKGGAKMLGKGALKAGAKASAVDKVTKAIGGSTANASLVSGIQGGGSIAQAGYEANNDEALTDTQRGNVVKGALISGGIGAVVPTTVEKTIAGALGGNLGKASTGYVDDTVRKGLKSVLNGSGDIAGTKAPVNALQTGLRFGKETAKGSVSEAIEEAGQSYTEGYYSAINRADREYRDKLNDALSNGKITPDEYQDALENRSNVAWWQQKEAEAINSGIEQTLAGGFLGGILGGYTKAMTTPLQVSAENKEIRNKWSDLGNLQQEVNRVTANGSLVDAYANVAKYKPDVTASQVSDYLQKAGKAQQLFDDLVNPKNKGPLDLTKVSEYTKTVSDLLDGMREQHTQGEATRQAEADKARAEAQAAEEQANAPEEGSFEEAYANLRKSKNGTTDFDSLLNSINNLATIYSLGRGEQNYNNAVNSIFKKLQQNKFTELDPVLQSRIFSALQTQTSNIDYLIADTKIVQKFKDDISNLSNEVRDSIQNKYEEIYKNNDIYKASYNDIMGTITDINDQIAARPTGGKADDPDLWGGFTTLFRGDDQLRVDLVNLDSKIKAFSNTLKNVFEKRKTEAKNAEAEQRAAEKEEQTRAEAIEKRNKARDQLESDFVLEETFSSDLQQPNVKQLTTKLKEAVANKVITLDELNGYADRLNALRPAKNSEQDTNTAKREKKEAEYERAVNLLEEGRDTIIAGELNKTAKNVYNSYVSGEISTTKGQELLDRLIAEYLKRTGKSANIKETEQKAKAFDNIINNADIVEEDGTVHKAENKEVAQSGTKPSQEKGSATTSKAERGTAKANNGQRTEETEEGQTGTEETTQLTPLEKFVSGIDDNIINELVKLVNAVKPTQTKNGTQVAKPLSKLMFSTETDYNRVKELLNVIKSKNEKYAAQLADPTVNTDSSIDQLFKGLSSTDATLDVSNKIILLRAFNVLARNTENQKKIEQAAKAKEQATKGSGKKKNANSGQMELNLSRVWADATVKASELSAGLKARLITEGTQSALKFLQDKYAHDPRMSRIIKKLLEMPDVHVEFDPDLVGTNIGGQYNPRTDSITLNPESHQTDIDLVHELVHAYTSWAFANKSKLGARGENIANRIIDTFNYIKSQPDFASRYELSSVDEFVAEFLANPVFRSEINQLLPAKVQGNTIIVKVKEILRKIGEFLGLKNPMDVEALIDGVGSIMRTKNHFDNATQPRNVFNRETKTDIYDHLDFAEDLGMNRMGNRIIGSAFRDPVTGLWNVTYFAEDGTLMQHKNVDDSDLLQIIADNKLTIKHRNKNSGSTATFDDKINRIHMINPTMAKFLVNIANRGPNFDKVANFIADTTMSWVVQTQNREAYITFAQRLANEKWKNDPRMVRDLERDVMTIKSKYRTETTQDGLQGVHSAYQYRQDMKNLLKKYGMSQRFGSEAMYYLMAQHIKNTKAQNHPGERLASFDDYYEKGRTDDDFGDKWYAQRTDAEKAFIADIRDLQIKRNNRLLDLEYEAGILTEEQYNKWRNEFYVPLKSEGTDINTFKRFGRKGRYTAAQDPWVRYEAEEEARIRNIENNSIAREFADYVTEYNLHEIASINRQTAVPIDRSTDFKYMSDAFVNGHNISFWKNGQRYSITITDEHLRDVMKRSYDQQRRLFSGDAPIARAFRTFAAATRFISLMRTTLNVSFVPGQFARDLTSSVFNAQAAFNTDRKMPVIDNNEALKLSMRIPRDAIINLAKIGGHKAHLTKDPFYKLFKQLGGGINLAARFDMESVQDRLQAQGAGSSLKARLSQGLKMTNEAAMSFSHTADEAVRFSAWKNFLELKAGKKFNTVQELEQFLVANMDLSEIAIMGSKNITGNFETKGGNVMLRGLWSFFNASMVGARMAGHAMNPAYGTHGIKVAMGVMALSALATSSMMDEWGDDDDERSKVERIRATRDGICAGDTCMQIPHELRWAVNFGRAFTLMNENEKYTEADAVNDVIYGLAQGMNPLSFGDFDTDTTGALVQGLIPTLAQPVLQDLMNQNSFGSSIRPDKVYDTDGKLINNPMDWQKTTMNVNQMYNDAAAFMYQNLGVDVSPSTMNHYVNFLLGGTAAMFNATVKNANENGGNYPEAFVKAMFRGFDAKYNDFAIRTDYEKKLQEMTNATRMGAGGVTLGEKSGAGAAYLRAAAIKSQVDKEIKKLGEQVASYKDILAAERQAWNQEPPDFELLERIGKTKQFLTEQRNRIYARGLLALEEIENDR